MSYDLLKPVKDNIRTSIDSLTIKACELASKSANSEETIERISRLVSRELTEKASGYLGSAYTVLKENTLKEDAFQDANLVNAFYDLELGSKILHMYSFDLIDLDQYCANKGYKKINSVYVSVGTAAGTLAIGSILIVSLTKPTVAPFIILVAGAVALGLLAYFKAGEIHNKASFVPIVKSYMNDLYNELVKWIDGVADYYQSQVDMLKEKQ